MEKINCEIIRDLIPSYVDGVCSEATKRCVEEHVAACDGCRQMLASYKSHMLSKKSAKVKRNLRKPTMTDASNVKNMKKILPYL